MNWTYLGERIIKKARKDHQCIHCRCRIPKGTGYHVDAWIFDGEFHKSKSHAVCGIQYRLFNADSCWDNWFELCDWEGFKDFQAEQLAKYGKYETTKTTPN